MSKRILPIQCKTYEQGQMKEKSDLVVVEEPLEIRIGFGEIHHRSQKSISVTMRTPGHDEELALGFLFTEGILKKYEDVVSVKHCTDLGKSEERENIIRVELKEGVAIDLKNADRNFYTTSSCGICGKTSIESVESSCSPVHAEIQFQKKILLSLPQQLRAAQPVFEHTGGLHAAGLFDFNGNLILLREDVGRHNATDKVIGTALFKELIPCRNYLLMLSGRISFELVQKAAMAGIPLVAAVGAPSTLAIDLAQKLNITLCGFLRDQRFNIYSHPNRVI